MREQIERKPCMQFFSRHCSSSIIAFNAVMVLVTGAIFSYFTPLLLNYPFEYNRIYREYSLDYSLQSFLILLGAVLLSSVVLWIFLKDVDEWEILQQKKDEISREKFRGIQRKFMEAPYKIFWIQITLFITPGGLWDLVFNLIIEGSWVSFAKVFVIIYSSAVLMAIMTFIFSKILFTEVLIRMNSDEDVNAKRIMLKAKVLNVMLPLLIATVGTSFLFGYSRIMEQRGKDLYKDYKALLEQSFSDYGRIVDTERALRILETVNVESTKICDFIMVGREKVIIPHTCNLGQFFDHYIHEFSTERCIRVFSEGAEINGAVLRLHGTDGEWYAGVKYSVVSREMQWNVASGCLLMIAIGVVLSFFFNRAITADVTQIGRNLSQKAHEMRGSTLKRIPITSNDEIGDIILALNRIREKDFEYDQLKTDFFANISHELRTPLSVILGTLQLLENNTDVNGINDEKKQRHFRIMHQNCHRLLRLVNNLIDSTRIDAGYFQLHLKNGNIIEIVEETVMSIVEYTREMGIELRFDTQVEEKFMAMDADILERILLNLISNAIKFSGKGSDILVSVLDQGESISISVKDNGRGIPLEKQKVIFERFRQADELLTRKNEGSGIGLALVKGFVGLLEGEISLTSEPGKGSEFMVSLPVRQFEDEDEIESAKIDDIKLNRMNKILIEFSDIK